MLICHEITKARSQTEISCFRVFVASPFGPESADTVHWCPVTVVRDIIPGRGIPVGCVAPRSNTPGILTRRALPSGRRSGTYAAIRGDRTLIFSADFAALMV